MQQRFWLSLVTPAEWCLANELLQFYSLLILKIVRNSIAFFIPGCGQLLAGCATISSIDQLKWVSDGEFDLFLDTTIKVSWQTHLLSLERLILRFNKSYHFY